MEGSIYMNPLRPQPYDGGDGTRFDGLHELVDYLPGTSIRFWYTSQPDSFADHWHDPLEIISCEKGHYISDAEDVQYRVEPGDVLIMPGGVVHTLHPTEDCRGYVMLFDMSPMSHINSLTLIRPFMTRPFFISAKDNRTLNQSVNALLAQMRNEYFGTNDLRELTVYSYLLMMLSQVGQFFLSGVQNEMHLHSAKHQEYMEMFNSILNDLSTRFQEEVTLEQVARQYGFSKFYFSRLFTMYTSYTFSDYLSLLHIQAAKKLLADPSLTITEVSEQSGFNSLSTFNRVFKNKVGCSPSRYRELYH